MLRSTLYRYVLPAMLAAMLLPPAAYSQSQDSQSVAEAARRAREKKKAQAKPVKVITDETLDVKKEDVQSAVAEEPKMPGASAQSANNAPGANAAGASAATKDSEDEKLKRELVAVKEQVKQAVSDLDLLQREYRLDQDTFYSNVNYGSDTAGKQKLDDEKQQISDKREEVERLKAKLADLQQALGITDSTAPKP